jgi:hypothetical protein
MDNELKLWKWYVLISTPFTEKGRFWEVFGGIEDNIEILGDLQYRWWNFSGLLKGWINGRGKKDCSYSWIQNKELRNRK